MLTFFLINLTNHRTPMNVREGFLKALAQNEDDTPTRLVYADWLDEQGEHEEADRQRKWRAAKDWLVWFCEANNSEDDGETRIISYKELIELGRQGIEEADERGILISCGNNWGMCDALRNNTLEFWKNWSVVTGMPLPADLEEKSHFRCGC